MYDPSKQYRCTIIRGKSQKEMDDLLPAYAKVIDEICPCSHQDFETLFNEAFKRYLPESERIKKTWIIIGQKFPGNYLECTILQKMEWYTSLNELKSILKIMTSRFF